LKIRGDITEENERRKTNYNGAEINLKKGHDGWRCRSFLLSKSQRDDE